MPDDKEVERLAEKLCRELLDCGVMLSDPNAANCVASPRATSALRSAMRIGEKRAYEDAAKKALNHYYMTGRMVASDIATELQAKADSLKTPQLPSRGDYGQEDSSVC